MARIARTVVRVGVVSVLGTGAAFLVAEAVNPGSARAIAHQAGTNLSQVINEHIDDPVAIRSQLRDLEAQYPKKIASVRSDLSELQTQIAEYEHERAVTARVVALADSDLADLQSQLTQAERSSQSGAIVRVAYKNTRMDQSQAYAQAEKIRQLRDTYAHRTSEIDRDMGFLRQQEGNLSDLLTKLETERAEFQSQLWQLDQQIDAVSRNDRLLTMLEKRQKTIDSISPYEADSLAQVTDRIAKIRAEQESRMAALTRQNVDQQYLDAARVQIDAENRAAEAEQAQPDELQDFGMLRGDLESRAHRELGKIGGIRSN